MSAGTVSRRWSIHVPEPSRPSWLAFDFAPDRCELLHAFVCTGPGSFALEPSGPFRFHSGPGQIKIEDRAELRVHYRGTPPSIARVLWAASAPNVAPVVLPVLEADAIASFGHLPAEWFAATTQPVGVDEADLVAPALDLRRAFALRRQALRDDLSIRAFFAAFDEHTTLPVGDGLEPDAIDQLSCWLETRLVVRAILARDAEPQVPVFHHLLRSGDLELRGIAARVSRLLLELAEEHLHFPGDQSLVGWAFEQFARSSLAVEHRSAERQCSLQGHGAPNSDQFLLLAELAFVCLAERLDAELWEAMLEPLVRATELHVDRSTGLAGCSSSVWAGWEWATAVPLPRGMLESARRRYGRVLARAATTAERHRLLEDRFSWLVGRLWPGTGHPATESRPMNMWPAEGPRPTLAQVLQ